ncbi:MAG: two-component system response regulator PilR (NtrC family), partial [Halieaceae bacterium]
HKGESIPELQESALETLSQYSFPGNVRELENILERSLTLSDGQTITADDIHLPNQPMETQTSTAPGTETDAAYGRLDDYMEDIERKILAGAMETSKWNRTAAAKLLGISFRSLRYRLKKLDMED